MDDLISRQAAINEIERAKVRVYHSIERAIGRSIIEILDDVEKDIRGLASAEPKKGKWIDKGITGDWQYQIDGRGRSWHEWECDQCKDMVKKRSFYCPNCGAKMEVTT